jgi:hypothetical protein
MKTIHSRIAVSAALALSVFVAAGSPRAEAAERESSTGGEITGFLVPEDELADVGLSIVDEKLAMSLAVETRIQIDLTEFVLTSIHDENLTALTERKLQGYRQLYETIDHLTGGRAGSMLARASRQVRRDADGTTAQASAAEDTTRTSRARPKKRARRGGLSSVLRNATTRAIVRVRLEIAEQYAAQLRTELELSPPGEFDRCYLGIEVHGQMQWLAMLRVFERHASPDFSRIIHLATVATEAHLLAARQMIEPLDNSLPLPDATDHVVNTGSGSGT